MFSTEPILWLQQFASEPLTAVAIALTSLGTREIFVLCCMTLLFGVDFRRGVLVMQALFAALLLTVACKYALELPRPWAVDARVLRLDSGIGGASDWGFPSGHTSSALAMWGAIAMLWRGRTLRALCVLLIVAVPLTRLYLGQHFIGDLLGGYALGLLVLLGVRRWAAAGRPVDRLAERLRASHAWTIGMAAGLPTIALAPIALGVPAEPLALIAGVELGLVAVLARGVPVARLGAWSGTARVLLALSGFVLIGAAAVAGGLDPLWVAALSGVVLIAGGVFVGRRFGLYDRVGTLQEEHR